MDIDVIFLGTAGSLPTVRRTPSATLLRRGGDRILVDCGEGTQRRLMQSVAGLCDLEVVLLTHHHADHVLGLPGLLRSFALRDRRAPLLLAGPGGTTALVKAMRPFIGRLTFDLTVRDVEDGGALERGGYRLIADATRHRGPSTAWSLVEDDRPGRFDVERARALGVPAGPLFGELQRGADVALPDGTTVRSADVVGETRHGRRIVISGDTRPCDRVLAAASGADLLVHEATFLEGDVERARETGHSTAHEAATLAHEADVGLLALVHLSARYPARLVEEEARAVFPYVVCPRDLDRVAVPFPERGDPELDRAGGRARRDAGVPVPDDPDAEDDHP